MWNFLFNFFCTIFHKIEILSIFICQFWQNYNSHLAQSCLKMRIMKKVGWIMIDINYWRPTLTLASERFVHMAISSLVDMSGYRFLEKVCSSSCNCCDVKWVLCRLCLLFFLPSLSSTSVVGSINSSFTTTWDCIVLALPRMATETKRNFCNTFLSGLPEKSVCCSVNRVDNKFFINGTDKCMINHNFFYSSTFDVILTWCNRKKFLQYCDEFWKNLAWYLEGFLHENRNNVF